MCLYLNQSALTKWINTDVKRKQSWMQIWTASFEAQNIDALCYSIVKRWKYSRQEITSCTGWNTVTPLLDRPTSCKWKLAHERIFDLWALRVKIFLVLCSWQEHLFPRVKLRNLTITRRYIYLGLTIWSASTKSRCHNNKLWLFAKLHVKKFMRIIDKMECWIMHRKRLRSK